jgi:hypothetical protein
MLKSLLLSLIMMLPLAVGAQQTSATLSWVAPTLRTDGSPLTNLAKYRIYYGTDASNPDKNIEVLVPKTSHAFTNLTGVTYFYVTAIDSAGLESERAGPVSNVVKTGPAAPSQLKVTFPTAYTVVKRVDGFVMLPVGTISVGTVCGTQRVNDYYVVPRASVTWSGSVKPDVVVAQCQ